VNAVLAGDYSNKISSVELPNSLWEHSATFNADSNVTLHHFESYNTDRSLKIFVEMTDNGVSMGSTGAKVNNEMAKWGIEFSNKLQAKNGTVYALRCTLGNKGTGESYYVEFHPIYRVMIVYIGYQ
jgi:hypothetical protein